MLINQNVFNIDQSKSIHVFQLIYFQVFQKEQIRSTLKVIFQNNVMRFEGGFMGAVNGMRGRWKRCVDCYSVNK